MSTTTEDDEQIRSLYNADKIKVIVSDLDNTLWDGILAEKQTLKLHKEYFKFLQEAYQKGIQLIIVTKNDLVDVEEAFEELSINKELFTVMIANWDAKYLNLEKLIHETQFRPETIIFIDDNPLERGEVRAKIPDIHCIDARKWRTLLSIPAIVKLEEQPDSEIKERVNRYRTSLKASEIKERYQEEDKEFLKTLKREIRLGEIPFDNLDRFTQLLVVTHRINFNPCKFENFDEAMDYLHEKIHEGYRLIAVSTSEQGLSLGLTGALVLRTKGDTAIIEDGTFSCGIIGRDFEQKTLIALGERLKNEGFKKLHAKVTFTSTNIRVREIFEEIGFKLQKHQRKSAEYTVKLDEWNPGDFDHIAVIDKPPELEYNGIPSIISFFEDNVQPLVRSKFKIVNLGAAKGEVLGHLQRDKRQDFYDWISSLDIEYVKVDLEYLPEEENIVSNAENLSRVVATESQDLVMAVELLEHTEHFWKVINEIIRICKVGGHIFITVPAYNYPKHEYPIDLWRIGPETLLQHFPSSHFEIIHMEKEGHSSAPRRVLLLVQKKKCYEPHYEQPTTGKVDWNTGITHFP